MANRLLHQNEATRKMTSLTQFDLNTTTSRVARCRGLTLVELLVVIVILTTLVSTAIPVLAPGGDERKIREASRQINAFISGAQSRAIQNGRPYGVELKRLSADTGNADDNGASVELRYVEVPPVYAGFSTDSGVQIARSPLYRRGNRISNLYGPFWIRFVTISDLSADFVPGSFLRPDDIIEIEGELFRLLEIGAAPVVEGKPRLVDAQDTTQDTEKGFFRGFVPAAAARANAAQNFLVEPIDFAEGTPWSDLPKISTKYDNNSAWIPDPRLLRLLIETDSAPEPPYWTAPATYKIYRQPTSASAAPLQLPAGIGIDLQASGFADGDQLYQPNLYLSNGETQLFTESVLLMFTPEGTLTTAHYPRAVQSNQENPVTSSLSLLVGRVELMPAEIQTSTGRSASDPIWLPDDLNGLSEDEQREVRDKYNWLNLESRWVVIGSQSGSVTTVPNSFINPSLDEDGDSRFDADLFDIEGNRHAFGPNGENRLEFRDQVFAARALAPRRTVQGGR